MSSTRATMAATQGSSSPGSSWRWARTWRASKRNGSIQCSSRSSEVLDVGDGDTVLEVVLEPVEVDVSVVDDGEHVGVRGCAEGADQRGADVGAAGSGDGEAAECFEVDEDGGVAVDGGAERDDGRPWVGVDVGGVGERRCRRGRNASGGRRAGRVSQPAGGGGGFGEHDDDVVVVDEHVAGAQHGRSCGEFFGEMAERGVACVRLGRGGRRRGGHVRREGALAGRERGWAAVAVVGLAAASVPVERREGARRGSCRRGRAGRAGAGWCRWQWCRHRCGRLRSVRCRRVVRQLVPVRHMLGVGTAAGTRTTGDTTGGSGRGRRHGQRDVIRCDGRRRGGGWRARRWRGRAGSVVGG